MSLIPMGAFTPKDVSPTNGGPNTDVSVVKVAMVSMTLQNWSRQCILRQTIFPDSVTVTDIGTQMPPLCAQNFDLGYTSESRSSSPLAVPGSLPARTTRGNTSKRETSLLVGFDDSHGAPSTSQNLGDGTLRGLRDAAEYFVVLAIERLRNLLPRPRDDLPVLGKIKNPPLSVLPSYNKAEHDKLLTTVVVT